MEVNMAEKEYIELGKLIDLLEWDNDIEKWVMSDGEFLMLLPADAVEVVRCAQCKHWKINPNNLYGGYCRYCESAKMDHFCSYGERKEATP
jgi:hypothetical protein